MTSVELQHYLRREFSRPADSVGRLGTERFRRALNVAVALIAIAVTAPLMIIIAVLIKLSSRGPILYTQERVGADRRRPVAQSSNGRRRVDAGGRTFKMYKFRTMVPNSGETGEVWARPDDPRVTRLGRILRLYRLDELPQLFNVLRGDMNIVGPRPEQPALFRDLRSNIEGYQERQKVLPGITGWAQINHHYDQSVDDVRRKLAFDLEYITRRSVNEDVRIMMRTVPVIMFKKGAW